MEEGNNEKRLIEERKIKLKNFLLNKKSLFIYLGLIVLLFLAWHVRTVNVPYLKDITTNDYTLGPDLDPYLFLRYAKYIVDNGKLMEHDIMRNVPLGFNTGSDTMLLPYMIVYTHKIINFFSEKNVTYASIMFPVYMFLLTVIAFFLFIRKIFENKKYKNIIALIATAFLIVVPSLLPRTVAGIPEKESAVFFFMFLAFYFFLCSWKSKNLKSGLIFGILAGISTAGMGLIWGGVRYIFMSISLATLIGFILGQVNKKRFLSYSAWVLSTYLLMLVFFPLKYNFKNLISDPTASGLIFGIMVLMLIDFLIFRTKIKDFIPLNLRRKIPDRVISLVIFVVLAMILATLFIRVSFIYDTFDTVVTGLTRSKTDRLSYTVAENKQPYFSEWENSFGPHIKDIAILFWLFFIGSIFLFYETVKNIEKREKLVLTYSYIIFLFSFIFNRYSPTSLMDGENNISKMVYFGGFLVIFMASCYLFYSYFKQGKLKELKRINLSYVLLLSFFFISLVGARSAIRLVMVLVPPVAGIVGFFSVFILEKVYEEKNRTLKIIFSIAAIIIIIASLYAFYYNYKSTLAGGKGMIPSAYTQQWQSAMKWVRENTEKDAVFAHWWDYGYWLQSIGNRASVVDGGNAIAYWNHLVGRHVLTGQSEREALEFLYTHSATHFLVDSTEIGKYGAYSSIGSDENYDRYSAMPIFTEDERNLQETKNEFIRLYRGGMFLDQDYLWKNNVTETTFPAYGTGIGGVFFIEDKNGSIKQPQVVFIYQGKQVNIPMRYVYYGGKKYDFGTGYGGCLYIVPRLISEGGRMFIKDKGTALFITEKSMNALWVKLYFFNEGENFELVHREDSFVVRDLKNQGFIEDFVFYQDIQGPIKIWKINYLQDIKAKGEYLDTEYPEKLREAKNIV